MHAIPGVSSPTPFNVCIEMEWDPFPHMRIDAFSEKSRLANRIADRLGKEKYPCIR
jgi:hypothetical protein